MSVVVPEDFSGIHQDLGGMQPFRWFGPDVHMDLHNRLQISSHHRVYSFYMKGSPPNRRTVFALITPLICCNCFRRAEAETMNFMKLGFAF
jgi:hypothetical protein